MLENLIVVNQILGYLENLIPIETWLESGYNFILRQSFLEQLIGSFLLVIIVILGVFALIKKLSKLIIVVAILVGLYLLYAFEVFNI